MSKKINLSDPAEVNAWGERMAALSRQSRQEPVQPPEATPAPSPSNVVYLPFWPEAVRGVPNGVLRSALFGAIKKGQRRYLEREEIHALDGIRIIYTGLRLDQGDLDVWETGKNGVRSQGRMGSGLRRMGSGLTFQQVTRSPLRPRRRRPGVRLHEARRGIHPAATFWTGRICLGPK